MLCDAVSLHPGFLRGGLWGPPWPRKFTPCSVVCGGIAACLGVVNSGYEAREGDYVGAGLDLLGAASFGLGRYLKYARNVSKLRYNAARGVRGMKSTRHTLGKALGRA